MLNTLLMKHFNDLLERQSCERGKDEVSYFYVEDVFCIHLGTKYADFQEKIFREISGKRSQTLCIRYIKMIFYIIHKVLNFFSEFSAKIFS